MLLLVIGCDPPEAEREKHYIPSGFVGQVIIFFNQDSGQEARFDSDDKFIRLYQIENDGILSTTFRENSGLVDDVFEKVRFFYLSQKNGSVIQLQVIYKGIATPKLDSNIVTVFRIQRGIFGENQIHYMSYFVDTLKNIDKYRCIDLKEEARRWTKIVEEKNIK